MELVYYTKYFGKKKNREYKLISGKFFYEKNNYSQYTGTIITPKKAIFSFLDWIPESRVDHEMLNPFITPKLKNISVKPPDLVKNEVKVAEIVTPTKITQPEKVEHVTVEAKIEPIIVEEIKVKPTFLHISLGKFLYLLTS